MNIRQYYEQSAIVSIHGGLLAFIPAIGLLLYIVLFSHRMELILLIIPFLIYSFSCYLKFLQNQNRANAVKIKSIDDQTTSNHLLSDTTLLLTLSPAPSLRLQLFQTNGLKAGELRDTSITKVKWLIPPLLDKIMVKKYVLYDEKDQPIAYYSLYRDQIEINIQGGVGKVGRDLNLVYRGIKQKNTCQFHQVSYQIEKNGLHDFSIASQLTKNKVGQIQTGWMPLEWNQRFIDANTPIFRLHESLSKEERFQIFATLILIYAYYDH